MMSPFQWFTSRVILPVPCSQLSLQVAAVASRVPWFTRSVPRPLHYVRRGPKLAEDSGYGVYVNEIALLSHETVTLH